MTLVSLLAVLPRRWSNNNGNGNPKGPPSSFVQLRSAVLTGDARDTRPISDIGMAPGVELILKRAVTWSCKTRTIPTPASVSDCLQPGLDLFIHVGRSFLSHPVTAVDDMFGQILVLGPNHGAGSARGAIGIVDRAG